MRYDKSTTQGRWPSILAALGVPAKTLSKRNVPCPFCEGKDRFRFTDQDGAGLWICNQCGNGNGIQFVERWNDCDFRSAVEAVNSVLGQTTVAKPVPEKDPRAKLNAIWGAAQPIRNGDPVARYLALRGFEVPDTKALRTHLALPYFENGKEAGLHPAMVALVHDKDGSPKTLHVTYLTNAGKKANVPTVRKVISKTGEGPAIRLRPVDAGALHIAEGIETALGAWRYMKERDLAVGGLWSVISAGSMAQFLPPPEVEHLVIWADNDASFTGQQAAYSLAHRLRQKQTCEVDVVVPKGKGTDWADQYRELT